jgi:3-oxoacyl-(acyl-carrier-protein) synthase
MVERRVLVTGAAIVNAAGTDADRIHDALVRGETFLQLVPGFGVAGVAAEPRAAAEVQPGWPPIEDRATQLALHAARRALHESGLDLERADLGRIGAVLGLEAGARSWVERASAVGQAHSAVGLPRSLQETLAEHFGLAGFGETVACDRASGAAALYTAWRVIRSSWADVVLAGGCEAPLSGLGTACHRASGELSDVTDPTLAYCPFDGRRKGLVLGEGAAVLVLEEAEHARRRGAVVLGEILGAAITTELTPTSTDAFQRAMLGALERAAVDPANVDLVLAEGAGTRLGDDLEAQALAKVFAAHPPLVGCAKPAYGHLFGASCATEVVLALAAARARCVPPIAGLSAPDVDSRVRLVREPTESTVSIFVANARSRYGANVSLVVADAERLSRTPR